MEVWKTIEGYSDYQVSSWGRIKSLPKTRSIGTNFKHYKESIRKPQLQKNGYFYIELCNCKKAKLIRIHRLVALAFIPNPENKSEVNHINCIKSDNRLQNLEWNTSSENKIHAFKNGLIPSGGDHHKARKVLNTVSGIVFNCMKDAANSVGMDRETLGGQLRGRRKNKTVFVFI